MQATRIRLWSEQYLRPRPRRNLNASTSSRPRYAHGRLSGDSTSRAVRPGSGGPTFCPGRRGDRRRTVDSLRHALEVSPASLLQVPAGSLARGDVSPHAGGPVGLVGSNRPEPGWVPRAYCRPRVDATLGMRSCRRVRTDAKNWPEPRTGERFPRRQGSGCGDRSLGFRSTLVG